MACDNAHLVGMEDESRCEGSRQRDDIFTQRVCVCGKDGAHCPGTCLCADDGVRLEHRLEL